MSGTCTTGDCTRPILARGLCAPCYSAWHRTQKKYTVTCPECGRSVAVGRKRDRYCSRSCSQKANNKLAAAKTRKPYEPRITQCEWCYAMAIDTGKFCSSECRRASAQARAKAMRSPLRAALEDGDAAAVLDLVRQKSVVQDNDCWAWTGSTSDGYPVLNYRGKSIGIHRAVIEAKLGKTLGSQAAHHTCANTICVNPDHLQPVTHRDNVAEMLARQSYLARIADLESALAALESTHPLLHVIPVV